LRLSRLLSLRFHPSRDTPKDFFTNPFFSMPFGEKMGKNDLLCLLFKIYPTEKMKDSVIRYFVVAIFLFLSAGLKAGFLEAYDLRCDLMCSPLGIDSEQPKLSWKLRSPEKAQRQTAWQVLVASGEEHLAADRGDIWDSGKQSDDRQSDIPYGGRPLKSCEQVFWKLKVWDRDGNTSAWTSPATWTMGIVSPADWKAVWITDADLLKWVRGKSGYRSRITSDAGEDKWVGVDLGKTCNIQTVRFYPVRQEIEEAQGLPLRFRIEISDNAGFKNATVIADYSTKNFPYTNTHHKTTVPTFDAPGGGVQGRYVRMVSIQLKPDGDKYYLAFNQIEILSEGKNIAAGKKVIAKDSDEKGNWSKTALTDGLEIRGANTRENKTLMARREFTVQPSLKRAIVNISGLGHYELTINGKKAGENLLSPGWTTYHKTCLYDTYDITKLLRDNAENTAGIILGNGMYNVRSERYVKLESPFRPLMVICRIMLEYADGHTEWVVTDRQWKLFADGFITFSNIFGGEDCDARIASRMKGWDAPGFDDRSWIPAFPVAGWSATLKGASHAAPPLKAFETLTPLRITSIKPGMAVYDLGQNVSLMPRIRVHGNKGDRVKLVPSELINADGTINKASCIRGQLDNWWQYTLNGDSGGEEWFPKFFYQGCRYLQVELLPAEEGGEFPSVDALEGVVVHTSSPVAGEFSCSNEMFNRIHTLIRWAQRSNLVSVITDCPHREKLGWLEQYHLNGPALRYGFDLARLYQKTFGDMADAQTPEGLIPDIAPEYVIFSGGFRDSPEWGSTVILAAWQQYEWTGDMTVFHRYYPVMCRYADYLRKQAKDGILQHGLGDWYDIGPKSPGISQLTPIPLTATATFYADLKTLAAIAGLLDKTDDAARYAAEAEEVRKAYNKAFFNEEKGVYATGSQCANAISLVFGLADPKDRRSVLDAIVNDVKEKGLTAGDVGYRYLLRALADEGRSDVIYAMNNQAVKPGYGYQLAQGATSLTEAWAGNRGSSQNHFMLGQLNEWFYHDLAGISADVHAPGFKNIIIRPQPVDGVYWAKAVYQSPRGQVAVSWKKTDCRLTLEVNIPTGATATVYMPASDAAPVMDDDRGIAAEQSEGIRKTDGNVFELSSGVYRLSANFQSPLL
jgi:hypothetical protein